jgi:hypothetical protein
MFPLIQLIPYTNVHTSACRILALFIFQYHFYNLIFLFCTYNTVSITLKRVSKRSSFRYAFQEHLLKFLMLAVTHSELLLRDHCISRHFKFKTYNCSSIYQRYQPLYLLSIIFLALCFNLFLNLRGKIEKILYYTRFISHFVALVSFITRATKLCLIKLV